MQILQANIVATGYLNTHVCNIVFITRETEEHMWSVSLYAVITVTQQIFFPEQYMRACAGHEILLACHSRFGMHV